MRVPQSAWVRPLRAAMLLLVAAPAFAHVGPGAHDSLFYSAPPGARTIPPGDFFVVEYAGEPGAEFILGVVKAKGEVDILWMTGDQFDGYKEAVAKGGGPISYDHKRSPLFLNQRWDDSWQVPEAGRYAIVVDNTRLPAGGGRGQEEAEVYIALGSDRPLSPGGKGASPPPPPSTGPPPPPHGTWLLQAVAGGGVAALIGWGAWRRSRAPRAKGRGRKGA